MPVRDDHENVNFVRDDLVEGLRDELPWGVAVRPGLGAPVGGECVDVRGIWVFAWGKIAWKLVMLRVGEEVDRWSESESALRFLKYDGV